MKTRRGFVLVGVAFAALLLAYNFRGLIRAVLRGERKDVRVVALEGESRVLPRSSSNPPVGGPPVTRASEQTLDAGGRVRRYVLVEPIALDRGKKYPLVLVFHGDGGEAASFHNAFRFEEASGAEAILAYPDGVGYTWDLESIIDNRDVKFAEAIIDDVSKRFPIDRARLFATGYSSGGFLSNVIACQRAGLLRAIASNAGGAPYKQALAWPNGYSRCPGQKPTAMLALHGQRDFGVTIDSGRFSAEYWAYVNGCTTDEMEPTGYDECRAYRGCPSGKAVGFCSIAPLGHWVWERAAEATWVFFNTQ